MGCFPTCFGTKHNKNVMKIQAQCLSPSHVEALLAVERKTVKVGENPIIKLNSESIVESEEQLNSPNREKITDDSHINTHMDVFTKRVETKSMENEVEIIVTEKGQNEDSSIDKEHVVIGGDDNNKSTEKYPEPTDFTFVQPESSDSLFSLSIDSRRQVSAIEVGEKEVSSPFKASERETKVKITSPLNSKYDDKENVVVNSLVDDGVAVDCTSLSTWLVEKDIIKSPLHVKSIANSPESEKNYGDRRVLEEVNTRVVEKMNECVSGRSTPRCIGVDDQAKSGTLSGSRRILGEINTKVKGKKNKCASAGSTPRCVGVDDHMKIGKECGDRPILGEINTNVVEKMNKCSSAHSTPRCGAVDDQQEIGTVGSYLRRRGSFV